MFDFLVVVVALLSLGVSPEPSGCRYGANAEVSIGGKANVCMLETTADDAGKLAGIRAQLSGAVHIQADGSDYILALAPVPGGELLLASVEMSRVDDHSDSTAAWLKRQLTQLEGTEKWTPCSELLFSGTKIEECRHAEITTPDGRRFGTTVGRYLSTSTPTAQPRLVVVRTAE